MELKAVGVSREAEGERVEVVQVNGCDLIVTFNRPCTDDEMRAFHDYIRHWRVKQ